MIKLYFILFVTLAGALELPPNKYELIGIPLPSFSLSNDENIEFTENKFLGKPLVLSFVYFSCPHTCSPLITHLKDSLKELDPQLKFNLLTVTFDPNDNKESLKKAREKFSLSDNWVLGYGSQSMVKKLTDALQFRFVSIDGGDFAHPNVIYVFDSELRLTKVLNGLTFKPRELEKALAENHRYAMFQMSSAAYLFWISAGSIFLILLFMAYRTYKKRLS